MSPRVSIFWLLLAAAALVRIGVLAAVPDALAADPDGYRELAENVVEHGVFGHGRVPTAYRPPAYPLLLVPFVSAGAGAPVAMGALHVALGLATVGLTFALARRAGMRDVPAALAGGLVALDPILLAQSTLVMSETLAALLVVLGIYLALPFLGPNVVGTRRVPSLSRKPPASETRTLISRFERWTRRPGGAALTGAAWGAAVLCRPALLAFAIPAAVVLPWLTGRVGGGLPAGRGREVVRTCGAMLAGLIVVISPWIVRNHLVIGRPTPATTHGGYTLLLGNNPFFYHHLRTGRWFHAWRAEPFHAWWRRELRADDLIEPAAHSIEHAHNMIEPPAIHDDAAPPLRFRSPEAELQADALAYRHAFASMLRQPGMFAWSCLVRAGRFWSPVPFQVSPEESPLRRAARRGVAAWYVVVVSLAAMGLRCASSTRRARRNVLLCSLLLAATLTAVHTFYWSNLRMRAPLMPLVALAAAEGATSLRRRGH